MKKTFSFKGISRSIDPLIGGEGECMTLMNLRACNGSLKPVPEPVGMASLGVRYSSITWHGIAECYVCITDDAVKTVHFYDKEWNVVPDENGNMLVFDELTAVTAVETIGSILCCMTEMGIRYIHYSAGKYLWLGESPPIPELNISLDSKLHVLTTEESFSSSAFTDDFESSWRYNEKGFIDECIHYLNIDGYYIDRALFRFAMRLYDGSYVYCSHVIYASDEETSDYVGRDSNNFYTTKAGTDTSSPYTVKVRGFKPSFYFSGLDLKNWKDVVLGIDVFTTGSIMGHKADTLVANLHDRDTGGRVKKSFEGYSEKSGDEIWSDVDSSYLFYKIAEYDVEGHCTYSVEDVSQTNLLLQQSMNNVQTSVSLSSLAASCSYTFNNRLHVASLRELLFAGYEASSLKAVNGEKSKNEAIAVQVKIRTNDGIATVSRNYGSIEMSCNNGIFELPPLLSYPDTRAFEMNVYVSIDTELFVKSFKLLPHKYLNQAQYLHKGSRSLDVSVSSFFDSGFVAAAVSDEDVLRLFSYEIGTYEVVYSEADSCWKYNGKEFPPDEFSNLRIFAIPRDIADGDKIVFRISQGTGEGGETEICNIPIDSTWRLVGGAMPENRRMYEERGNVMKVSAVDNPFIFPAKCTYSPSQTPIIAMASNTLELSQGRFGEHPLFVFCEDGIWVMAIDPSGTLAYSGCYPYSREVCCNVLSVCSIDSGVVFVGERGIMLISGNTIKELSAPLLPENNIESFHQENDFFVELASLVYLQEWLANDGFCEYIRSCRIAYNGTSGEIVVMNGQYGYCYIYSLKNNLWSCISCSASGFVSSYSSLELFAHKGSETSVFTFGNGMSGSNKVLLITRPLLWGTKLHKRIEQIVLHAYASLPLLYDDRKPVLACYLLGSNDGLHFRILKGSEIHNEAQDIRFPFNPTQSYRYYIFAVAGVMGVSSILSGIEADVEIAWGNRIR